MNFWVTVNKLKKNNKKNLTKEVKKMLNVKLWHYLAGSHALPYEVSAFIYIYIYI